MAFGAAGIGGTGNGLTVAALTILADQHFAVFAVHSQKLFAAAWADLVGEIVVAESALS